MFSETVHCKECNRTLSEDEYSRDFDRDGKLNAVRMTITTRCDHGCARFRVAFVLFGIVWKQVGTVEKLDRATVAKSRRAPNPVAA